MKTLHIASGYGLLGALLSGAIMSAAMAADTATTKTTETFTQIAERFGLWAALCVLLVIASVYSLYQQSMFVHKTLVQLVQANQRCIDRNTEALRDAPCGRNAAKEQDKDESSNG